MAKGDGADSTPSPLPCHLARGGFQRARVLSSCAHPATDVSAGFRSSLRGILRVSILRYKAPGWKSFYSTSWLPVRGFSSLPSGKTTLVSRKFGAPVLSGFPIIVTTSPAFMEFLLQPRRTKKFKLPASHNQLTRCPLPSVTSTRISVCGFINSKLVTVPFIVTTCVLYAEVP